MVGLKTLVAFVCLAYLFYQTIANGLMTTSVDSIQARYYLNSVDAGIISASMDVGSIVMLIVVAFRGENVNKPRWISISSMVIGIGSILFSIPHFGAPGYSYENKDFVNYCGNVTESECNESSLKGYMALFIAGSLLIGGGLGSLFTHGLTYIDDNTSTKGSSICTSIFYIMAALGPILGFLVGGSITELFVHPTKSVDINSSHPLWIGAWWPGYTAFGIIIVIAALPLLKMPQKLSTVKSIVMGGQEPAISVSWQKRAKMLRKNTTFILVTLIVGLNQAFVLGFNAFGVKYVASQYGLTTFQASLVFGITAVFAVTVGHVVSGAVMAKFELKVKGIIKFCLIASFTSVIFTFGFLFYCGDDKFAGGTVQYSGESDISIPRLDSRCNENCGCSRDWYKPVRGSDDIVYYSPCFAGCAIDHFNGSYSNCECIYYSSNNTLDQTAEEVSTTSDGFCWMLIGFCVVMGLGFFTTILTISPSTQLTIRCVSEAEKSSAISVQQVVALLIGNIPGRVLTGKVLDMACVVWSTKCGEQASCKVYTKWDMALYMFLLLQIEAVLIFILFAAIYFINRTKNEPDKQVDQNGNVNPGFQASPAKSSTIPLPR